MMKLMEVDRDIVEADAFIALALDYLKTGQTEFAERAIRHAQRELKCAREGIKEISDRDQMIADLMFGKDN